MALDPSFIGRVYPATPPYEVGRAKIREFALAVGDDHAAYRDTEAAKQLGHPDVIAPPTFPVVIAMAANEQVVADPALGLDYTRVVHAEQRFAYTRPVRAGDRLVATVTIEAVQSRAGNDFLTTRADLVTEAGEPVVAVTMRLVARAADGEE